MAYRIQLFARSGEPVAQRAALRLVEESIRLDPAISAKAGDDGVGWAAWELAATRAPAEEPDDLLGDLLPPEARGAIVHLGLSTRPEAVKDQVAWALEVGGPDSVAAADTLIEITLSGPPTDWATVHALGRAAIDLWGAVIYDEDTGFASSLDEDG